MVISLGRKKRRAGVCKLCNLVVLRMSEHLVSAHNLERGGPTIKRILALTHVSIFLSFSMCT